MQESRSLCRPSIAPSAFAGFRFPPEVITLAVRWYLRLGLSYRDVEELLAERGVDVDHVTVFRLVQRFTPLLIDAVRPCRHIPGDRWFIGETYVKVSSRWVTCTARSISSVRSSTYWCQGSGIWQLPADSSPDAEHHHAHPGRGHHRQGGGLPTSPRWLAPGTLFCRAAQQIIHAVGRRHARPVTPDLAFNGF